MGFLRYVEICVEIDIMEGLLDMMLIMGQILDVDSANKYGNATITYPQAHSYSKRPTNMTMP